MRYLKCNKYSYSRGISICASANTFNSRIGVQQRQSVKTMKKKRNANSLSSSPRGVEPRVTRMLQNMPA